tara:strand:+ start:6442 stop:7836 length:1395 start_codon:yes stop_codon:yes gene_type:complete
MDFFLDMLGLFGIMLLFGIGLGAIIAGFNILISPKKKPKSPPNQFNKLDSINAAIFNNLKNKEKLDLFPCDLEDIQIILDNLENDINKIQGWMPDKWWNIVKERGVIMKNDLKKNKENNEKLIVTSWILNHCNEYENRKDWQSIEVKEYEIGFRIERYSEILYYLHKAYNEIYKIVIDNNKNLNTDINLNSFIKMEDLKWWLDSTKASLLGCFLYAKKIGLSKKEIEELVKVDYKMDKLFKEYDIEKLIKINKVIEEKEIIKKPKNNNSLKPFTNFHNNGKLRQQGYLNSKGKPEGKCKEYYENGKLYKNTNMKDGMPHGKFKEYFENGKLKIDYNFKEGIQDGKQIEYYDNGNINIIGNYKNGVLHGSYTQYYPSGKLELSTSYTNGLNQGVHLYLKENGEVIEEKIMQDGIDITNEVFLFMTNNNSANMINAGLVKDGPQNFSTGELSKKMYDYYLKFHKKN